MLSPLIVILLLFYALLVATALLVWLTLTLPGRQKVRSREARETPAAARRAPKDAGSQVSPRVTVARPAEPATGSSLESPTEFPRNPPGSLSTPRPSNDATRGAWAKRESGEARTGGKETGGKEKGKEDDPFERFVRSRRDDLDL